MKKILLISLALVLALGGLGVAGALWSDWLYIDGYVETGYIGAEWSLEGCWVEEEKDVSFIDAWITGDTLNIDIWNAYPSAYYVVMWNIECTGSVPIHFDWPWIGTDLPAGATFTFTDTAGVPIKWYGYQMHPGEILWGMLTIHLENDAEQRSSYYFYIDLQYGQYNEFPPV